MSGDRGDRQMARGSRVALVSHGTRATTSVARFKGVEIRMGHSSRCRILLAVVALLASASLSHAQDSKAAFCAGGGFVKPADVDGTVYLTGGFSLKVAPTVAVEPEFSYWKKSDGVEDLIRLGVSDTTIGASVVFRPAIAGPVGVHLGVGPSVHFAKLSASLVGMSGSDTQTKLGGQAFVGADIRVSQPVWLFATARYDLVAEPDWGDEIGSANISAFKVYGGLRVNF